MLEGHDVEVDSEQRRRDNVLSRALWDLRFQYSDVAHDDAREVDHVLE